MPDEIAAVGEFRMGRVFSRCVSGFSNNVTTIIVVVVLFSVLPDLAFGLVSLLTGWAESGDVVQQLLQVYGGNFLNFLTSLSATIVIVHASVRQFEGRPVSLGESFGQIPARYLGTLATAFVLNLAVSVGLALLIVPGVLVAVRWVAAIPAKIMGDTQGGSAIDRSQALTRGFRGQIFGAMAIMAVVVAGPVLLIYYYVSRLSIALGLLVGIPLSNAIFITLTGLFVASVYFELKTARNGETLADVFA